MIATSLLRNYVLKTGKTGILIWHAFCTKPYANRGKVLSESDLLMRNLLSTKIQTHLKKGPMSVCNSASTASCQPPKFPPSFIPDPTSLSPRYW